MQEFVVVRLVDIGGEIIAANEIVVADSATTGRNCARIIHDVNGISCTVFQRQDDGSLLHIGV